MQNKQCMKCKEIKLLSEFGKHKGRKDGLSEYCLLCSRKLRTFYDNKFPWRRTLQHIKQRCLNPKCPAFDSYGGRGIKCLITADELKVLWFRDRAYEMIEPHIHRKNNDSDYIFDNCQYLEKSNHLLIEKEKSKKPVLQYNNYGVFIKEFESINDVERKLGFPHQQIVNNLKGNQRTVHGFIWRYKLSFDYPLQLSQDEIRIRHQIPKEVLQFSFNGDFIRSWPSAMAIQRELHYANTNISSNCLGKAKSAYGFIWKHKEKK
jgi:hypothetical protein